MPTHDSASAQKLVYMANQIGKFFATQSSGADEAHRSQAVAAIADHLSKFWDPRMRAAIIAHVAAGGAGLDPPVRSAVESLVPKVSVG